MLLLRSTDCMRCQRQRIAVSFLLNTELLLFTLKKVTVLYRVGKLAAIRRSMKILAMTTLSLMVTSNVPFCMPKENGERQVAFFQSFWGEGIFCEINW